MILTTCDAVPGRKVVKCLGLVRGNTIRSRNIGRDILAMLKNIIGGEISDYTKMLAEAREQALDRMRDEALLLDANAIITVRFASAEVMKGAAELLVYGTAVILEDSPDGNED